MKCICILPIGEIDGNLLLSISGTIQNVFGRPTRVLVRIERPESAYDQTRGQYLSTAILKSTLENADESTEKIIGVTDTDIFVPVLKFVFGQAQFSGTAALVSLCRLRQEFYDLPENQNLLAMRLRKEVVHELGHAYGLVHCRNAQCVMHYSNSLREVDARPLEFCDTCFKLLRDRLAAEE